MAEASHTPGEPPTPSARRRGLAAALPFVATAVVAVVASLLLQALLQQPTPSVVAPTAPPPPAAAPTATPAPAATPALAATPAPGDDRVLALQLRDLQEQNRQLWSAVYLLRAASQISDAVGALESNDLAEADRVLLTVYRSLEQAYAASAEQEKGPIDTFRLELSSIRDDLRLRPDGADRRLRRLRQLVLSLVDEGG